MSEPSLSALSLSDNPGLTRAETPRTGHGEAFVDARVATPQPTGAELEELAITNAAHASHMAVVDTASSYPAALGPPTSPSISGADVEADPILHHIAHTQPTATPFRARAAPLSTHYEGVGPRLTKSAALRQGLEWEDPRDLRRSATSSEEAQAGIFDNVPGHKRAGLQVNVDSLAEPVVAPRQNRAAMLRLGISVEEPTRDMAASAAANKARDAAERAERRRSIQLPINLTHPESLPRQNRAALLRLGQLPASHGRDPRDVAEQAVLNKEREAAERLAKRKSVVLPASLAAPTIQPRLNRSSMLRTGEAAPTPRAPAARPMSMFVPNTTETASRTTAQRFAADKAEKAARRASMTTPLRSLAAPVIAPRTNRASALRTDKPAPLSLSRTTSTSSLTSMSTRTSNLNPAPLKPVPAPMPSPRSKYLAPRPAPVPPKHRPSASISSELSGGVSRSSSPGSDKRDSIFRRLSLKPSVTTSSASSGPRPTKSSLLREGLGAKIGKSVR